MKHWRENETYLWSTKGEENAFRRMKCRGIFGGQKLRQGYVAVAATNDDSLVLRLKYRDRTLLLPGDAEKQAEHAMLEENSGDLHADVLKVGIMAAKIRRRRNFWMR